MLFLKKSKIIVVLVFGIYNVNSWEERNNTKTFTIDYTNNSRNDHFKEGLNFESMVQLGRNQPFLEGLKFVNPVDRD